MLRMLIRGVNMQSGLLIIVALWLIYGFLGFIVETVYVSSAQRKFVERGFLTGPIIPIYAFGALLILFALDGVKDSMILVFVCGVLLTSILEYFGSYVMEKFFNLKLWDYSKRFMNVNGRICLLNSTLFGILSVVVMFYINPFIMNHLESMNQTLLTSLVFIFMSITAVDFTFSVLAALHIRTHLDLMSELKLKFSEVKDQEAHKHAQRYKFIKERLYRAFPNMQSAKFENVITELRQYYSDRKDN